MSSIEERLVRDIAAVTRGVVVTDSDLRDAQAAVAERIGNVRQQDRRRSAVAVAAAAAAVVVLLLGLAAYLTIGGDDKAAPPAGPGPSSTPSIDNHASFLTGNAPTPDLIEGIWRLDNGGVLMRFASPDLVSWDRGGRLFEDPSVQGRYTIDGDTITITVDGGPAGCGGQHIVMRASVPERGAMRFVFTEPGEGPCNGAKDERWVMEQVLPPGPVFTDFDFAGVRGWQLLRDPTRLHGTWAAVGGGYALELAPNGEYHIAAGRGEQVDYGDWEMTGSRITLTSRPDSVECTANDRLVLGDVEFVDAGTSAIRSTVQENTCDAAWAEASWFLIPQGHN
jgi:hypothetical protein